MGFSQEILRCITGLRAVRSRGNQRVCASVRMTVFGWDWTQLSILLWLPHRKMVVHEKEIRTASEVDIFVVGQPHLSIIYGCIKWQMGQIMEDFGGATFRSNFQRRHILSHSENELRFRLLSHCDHVPGWTPCGCVCQSLPVKGRLLTGRSGRR